MMVKMMMEMFHHRVRLRMLFVLEVLQDLATYGLEVLKEIIMVDYGLILFFQEMIQIKNQRLSHPVLKYLY